MGLGLRAIKGGAVAVSVAAEDGEPRELAANGLREIVRSLEEMGCKPVVAALLVNRTGWIADLLEYARPGRSICRSPKDSRCATPFGSHWSNAVSKSRNWTRNRSRT